MDTIQPKAGEGIAQVSLRLPVGLHQAVKAVAQERGQSVNTMIVMSLRKETAPTSKE